MYLLFAGSQYYPFGGFFDFQGAYDTVEEAVEAGARYDWWHVVVGVSIVRSGLKTE